MKKNFHPKINNIQARCLCGETFSVVSTRPEIIVSFCSRCHPFFTNKQQHADIEGRIDKFNKKYSKFSAK